MELSVQDIYGLLLRSRLLSVDDARALHERWQAEAKEAALDPVAFANWMVSNNCVTEYQASLLSRGHSEGFFVGEYKIQERAGRGRMAGVYRAVHPSGQNVAIKVLPPSKARDSQLLARFQREASLALRLNHANIVRTYQSGEAEGLSYLVMEYLEGETLDEVLRRRGSLPPSESVHLIHQALLGLQHIHEQGLVHRDLKPANLMLVPNAEQDSTNTTLGCTLKVLDIGLGRVLFDETIPEHASDPTLTSKGTVLGTPDYMAPEQACDPRSADIRSDIYSLGCVFYHCLTGQPPFPDTNVISQMIRHNTEPPPPLRRFNSAIPDGLQQVVDWMLAKAPEQRYPTPEHAARALFVFLVAGNEMRSSPEADPKMRNYLAWLETDSMKRKAASPWGVTMEPATLASNPFAATNQKGPASPSPVPQISPVKTGEMADQKKATKEKTPPSIPKAVPLSEPTGGPPSGPIKPPVLPDFRLETNSSERMPLLLMPPPAEASLNRRDLLMFGAGIAGAGAAIFLGWAFANLRRKKSSSASE